MSYEQLDLNFLAYTGLNYLAYIPTKQKDFFSDHKSWKHNSKAIYLDCNADSLENFRFLIKPVSGELAVLSWSHILGI